MQPEVVEVKIRDLPIDTPLAGDILTPSGQVIVRQGRMLEQSLVDHWIQSGFEKVLLRIGAAEPYEEPLNDEVVQEVSQCVAAAGGTLTGTIQRLVQSPDAALAAIKPILVRLLAAVQADCDSTLWALEHQYADDRDGHDNALAIRSIALGTLGASIATQLGASPATCTSVAMAGALHDLALYSDASRLLQAQGGFADGQQLFQRHSLLGAELIASCREIDRQVQIAMTQVHEQLDGSGYPRGLRGDQLLLEAKILNLADAYLSLIDLTGSGCMLRADAIAYLVSQTAKGVFDQDCMRAFLKATSIYGIGSKVMLDDYTVAWVIRSSITDPMRPIVRVDGPHGHIIDLRRSIRSIDAPLIDDQRRRRLAKSELGKAKLWHGEKPAQFP